MFDTKKQPTDLRHKVLCENDFEQEPNFYIVHMFQKGERFCSLRQKERTFFILFKLYNLAVYIAFFRKKC